MVKTTGKFWARMVRYNAQPSFASLTTSDFSIRPLVLSVRRSLSVDGCIEGYGRLFVLLVLFFMRPIFADDVPVHRRSKSQEELRVKIDLVVGKERVVVGEQVPYTIRVTYDPQRYELSEVVPPTIDRAFVEELQGPFKEPQRIDGHRYMVYEWRGAFYPELQGESTVGPVQVAYISKDKRRSRPRFGGFFTVFDQPVVRRINSKSFIVHVDPLPTRASQGIFSGAVGTFTRVAFRVDRDEIKQGEAVVIRYGVVGCGNLAQLSHPLLQLPEGLKVYNSESRHVAEGKIFEYILQATQAGDVVIPSQQFVYFDTEKRSYQVLTTPPLTLKVAPGTVVQQVEDDLTLEQRASEQDDSKNTVEIVQESDSLPTVSWIRRVAFSPVLFWAILIILVVFGVLRELWPSLVGMLKCCRIWYDRKKNLKQIKKILTCARMVRYNADAPLTTSGNGHAHPECSKRSEECIEGNERELYRLFQKLEGAIDWQKVKQNNRKLYDKWKMCWDELVQVAFASDNSIVLSEDFFQRASHVINDLERGVWFL